MDNPYIPMSTETKLVAFYEFVEQVTDQADFNNYFEAVVEMAQRRDPTRTKRRCQEIAFTNMLRCSDSTNANPDVHQWLEALRPDGYVDFIER